MRKYRTRRIRTQWRVVRTAASLTLLGIAVAVTVGVVLAASGTLPGPTPGKVGKPSNRPIVGVKGHATCDEPGQPACPAAPDTWRAVASDSPAAVLAALQSCPDYLSPARAVFADPSSTVSFDTPVLVLPAIAGSHETDNNDSHWVIRASVNGHRRVTYDVVYDRAQHRLRIASTGGNLPGELYYDKPFPFVGVTQSAAAAAVQSSRGMGVAGGKMPELVFFSGDTTKVGPTHGMSSAWVSGGLSAVNPIWRVRGMDGRPYFVGIDGRVYDETQLPIEPGTTVMTL